MVAWEVRNTSFSFMSGAILLCRNQWEVWVFMIWTRLVKVGERLVGLYTERERLVGLYTVQCTGCHSTAPLGSG